MNNIELYQEAIQQVKDDLEYINNIIRCKYSLYEKLLSSSNKIAHSLDNSQTGTSPLMEALTKQSYDEKIIQKYSKLVSNIPPDYADLVKNKYFKLIEYKNEYWRLNIRQYYIELKKAYELIAINDIDNLLTYNLLTLLKTKQTIYENQFKSVYIDIKLLYKEHLLDEQLNYSKSIINHYSAIIEDIDIIKERFPEKIIDQLVYYLENDVKDSNYYRYIKISDLSLKYIKKQISKEIFKEEIVKIENGKFLRFYVEIAEKQQVRMNI